MYYLAIRAAPPVLQQVEGGEWRSKGQGCLVMRAVLALPFFPWMVVWLILCFHPQVSPKEGGLLPTVCSLFEVGLAIVGAVITSRVWDAT